MKLKKNLLYLFLAVLFFSCATNEQKQESSTDSLVAQVENPMEKNGIRLTEAGEPAAFPDGKIKAVGYKKGEYIKPGKVKFEFSVENYTLGNQTPDAGQKMCANSQKGQHIHFILNNGPYSALYEPKHEVELEEGQYTLLAFLSRSYHESIKTKNAYSLTQFIVGQPKSIDTLITEDYETGELYKTEIAYFKNDKKQQVNLPLEKNPYLFFSRPKGTYTGADTKKIMLDFYLVNTEISEQGNKVKAMIDSTEFIITKWAAYIIEGLSMGEHKISLTLVDKEGNPVFWAAPFYESGERNFMLQEEEPVTVK